jgi:hypothetical protein
MAVWSLAPKAQSGIQTIEVSWRKNDYGTLSQRERMVLKTVISRPELRQKKTGTFIGSLPAADLDKRRAVLRDVIGLDSAIRCILDETLEADVRHLFGGRVKAEGDYESDTEGRPRLMHFRLLESDNLHAKLI